MVGFESVFMGYKRITSDKQRFYKWIYVLIGIFLLFLLVKSFSQSLAFKKKDRINLIVYDEHARYYSLSQTGSVDYMVEFEPDTQVKVPGGYNYYRIGALGWLIHQEKKPEIMKKAISAATATFTDLYFYPGGQKIYYSRNNTEELDMPTFYKVLFYKSNATFFDRLYVMTRFLKGGQESFHGLRYPLESHDFIKKYQGHFYQKSYRNDNKIVQIIYTKSFNNASTISNILEGNGIRVGDFAQQESNLDNRCEVKEEGADFSETAKDIAHFLQCSLKSGKTGTFDIIIELNGTEKEWDIN